jgi:hypothetical protein
MYCTEDKQLSSKEKDKIKQWECEMNEKYELLFIFVFFVTAIMCFKA